MEVVFVLLVVVAGAFFLRRAFGDPQEERTPARTSGQQASGPHRSSDATPSARDAAPTQSHSYNLTSKTADSSDERELLRQLWRASTLNYAVYGPAGVEELSELIKQRAPKLRGSLWGPHQVLYFEEDNLTLIGAFLTGPKGSAFVLSNATTDGPTDTDRLLEVFPFFELSDRPVPTESGGGQWTTTLFVEGTTSDAELAEVVAAASNHPIGILDGFVDVAGSDFPAELARKLLDNGWGVFADRPGLTILATNVQTRGTRTQVALFGNEGPDSFRWNSAIAASPQRYEEFLNANIELPDGYELEPPGPENEKGWVTLRTDLRSDMTVTEVNDVAIAMAVFADSVEERLWGDDLL